MAAAYTQEHMDNVLQVLRAEHAIEMDALRAEHANEMDALRAEHATEMDALRTQLQTLRAQIAEQRADIEHLMGMWVQRWMLERNPSTKTRCATV